MSLIKLQDQSLASRKRKKEMQFSRKINRQTIRWGLDSIEHVIIPILQQFWGHCVHVSGVAKEIVELLVFCIMACHITPAISSKALLKGFLWTNEMVL